MSAYLTKNNIHHQKMGDFPFMCSAARLNSFGIRSTGKLYKCGVALEHKSNQVGYIKPDGCLSINKDYFMKWCRGLKTGNHEQLHCPLNGIS